MNPERMCHRPDTRIFHSLGATVALAGILFSTYAFALDAANFDAHGVTLVAEQYRGRAAILVLLTPTARNRIRYLFDGSSEFNSTRECT
jgi:hypothetical protein